MGRIIKLPIGQGNIPYIKVKAGYADGAKRPRRAMKQKETVAFNAPVLCIKLRKAA